jgi:hypothetical protein
MRLERWKTHDGADRADLNGAAWKVHPQAPLPVIADLLQPFLLMPGVRYCVWEECGELVVRPAANYLAAHPEDECRLTLSASF